MKKTSVRSGSRELDAYTADGRVRIGESEYVVKPLGDGLYRVTTGERRWVVAVAGPADDRWVFVDGQIAQIEIARSQGHRRRQSGGGDLSSPMPATVIRVPVTANQPVTRGDTLVVLEAMKMELAIRAPRDGVVRAVRCQPGELVQPGTELVELA